jgi:hypothetical protein
MKEGKKANRTYAIFTDHAKIIVKYLGMISKLRSYGCFKEAASVKIL